MKTFFLGLASIAFILSACAVETKVQQGRMALLYGDPNAAIASFQSAAELDPNYFYFSVFPQGIWTYMGRAYYITGKYPEARHALERAISLHKDDNMAKLYLGLNLARSGDRQRGLNSLDLAFGERQQLNFFEMLLDDLFRTGCAFDTGPGCGQ